MLAFELKLVSIDVALYYILLYLPPSIPNLVAGIVITVTSLIYKYRYIDVCNHVGNTIQNIYRITMRNVVTSLDKMQAVIDGK